MPVPQSGKPIVKMSVKKHRLCGTFLVSLRAAAAVALTLAASFFSPANASAQVTKRNPRVSAIGDQTGPQNVETVIPFTVDDDSALLPELLIQATSSNQALIPNNHIRIYGTGTRRSLDLSPALDQTGSTSIGLAVQNAEGGTARQSFLLTIEPDQNRGTTVLMLSALVQESPPQITLIWTDDPTAHSYTVYRRTNPTGDWGGPVATLPARHSRYIDTNVTVGSKYEYKMSKAGPYDGIAYLQAGIRIALTEERGTVILIVDNTYAQDLALELSRLEKDSAGDGWKVIRHDVNRNSSVGDVKALIKADFVADPRNVNTVFLFGHVPIAYSGIVTAPDGHTTDLVAGSHMGAWPADVYYADMDGIWTDEKFADRSPQAAMLYRLPNRNFTGDGKFDQDFIPSDVELQVGRVDLFNMTAFLPKTEKDLLRQYLNKDHDFRHGKFEVKRRGIALDKFPAKAEDYQLRKGLPASGSVLSTFFGSANVIAKDWFPDVITESYLCGYAGGPAHDTGINDWVGTSQFASANSMVVFSQLFGSYFADWHTGNNFLRAPLAAAGYGLTSSWGGRPTWKYYPMALGETVGFCAKASQNNNEDTVVNGQTGLPFSRGIWIALMGDPTLRLHPVAPPTDLILKETNGEIHLQWTMSQDAVEGYHIYRAISPNGPYSRLSGPMVSRAAFIDSNPLPGPSTYMVRAVKVETSASGTYFNPSQGVFKTVQREGVDMVKPTLSITSPSEGSIVYETVDLITSASDNSAVSKVEFRIEDTLIGTVAEAPYEVTWNTTAFARGRHVVSVIAHDLAGNTSTQRLSVTVRETSSDKVPPAVSITSPLSPYKLFGRITVDVQATDDDKVERVELLVDKSISGRATRQPYQFAWEAFADKTGTHNLTALAYDRAGNKSEASIQVEVKKEYGRPTIFLATPHNLSAAPGEPVYFTIHFQGGPTELNNDGVIQYIKNPHDTGYFDIHRTPTFSSQWTKDLTYAYSYRLPRNMIPGTYAIMYILATGPNREQLNPGPGVYRDWQERYQIGTVTVLPDTNAPSVSLTYANGRKLVDGQRMAGQTELRVCSEDLGFVQKVQAYFDAKLLFENIPAPSNHVVNKTVNLDVRKYTNGNYVLKVVASDVSGNANEKIFHITVANPSVYPLSVQNIHAERGKAFDCVFNFSGGPLAEDHEVSVFFQNVGGGRSVGPVKHQPIPRTSQWPGGPLSYRKTYGQFPVAGTFEIWVSLADDKVPLVRGSPEMGFDDQLQRYKVGTLTVTAGPPN
jgi:hypothetical protein